MIGESAPISGLASFDHDDAALPHSRYSSKTRVQIRGSKYGGFTALPSAATTSSLHSDEQEEREDDGDGIGGATAKHELDRIDARDCHRGSLTTAAVPAMNNVMTQQRLGAGSSELFATFNLARSEAIKRNVSVVVTPADQQDWSSGWKVFEDRNDNSA